MKVLTIAPHPDDETLGCGGTLLRHKLDGDEISWLIVTNMTLDGGWTEEQISLRNIEISKVSKEYGFSNVFNLQIPTTKLDDIPFSDLINRISKIYSKLRPEIIYIPFSNDVHTDHQIISKVMQSTIKWFRYPSIKKVLMYETISETEYNFISKDKFHPNTFVDITNYIDKKIEILKIYKSEIKTFPFPRSEKVIRSLSILRGSQSGFNAAEGFELIYNRV